MVLLLFIVLIKNSAFANEIAFTIDDAPRGNELIYTGEQRTQRFIEILKKYKIQTAFFVNTANLAKDNGKDRIEKYANAGHIIANHTHSHPDARKVSITDYLDNIQEAHGILKNFKNFRPWFRFPYLHEGNTLEFRDEVRRFLKSIGDINGYVTIDNYDYYINDLVQKSLADMQHPNLDRACGMLVDVMWEGILFYDKVARDNIGKVRHVLLMHENDLEAYCLERLITHLQKHKWKIISPIRAFEDPLLKNEPNTLYLSQGRVAAIAHVKSKRKYVSKWEFEHNLEQEFQRRKILSK